MNITEFKQDDIICRVEPISESVSLFNMFTFQSETKDYNDSYLGEKMTFIGIANGLIYLKKFYSEEIKTPENLMTALELKKWFSGWNFYIDPHSPNEKDSSLNKDKLKEEFENAIKSENYELAAKLKSKLK